MKDTLQQFARLKRQLTEEREAVANRLAAINAVLETPGEHGVSPTVAQPARVGGRRTGKLTLGQAVLDALSFGGGEKGNGLTISRILPLVQRTAGKTHKVNRVTVNLACLRLRDTGKLKNPSRGVYVLA